MNNPTQLLPTSLIAVEVPKDAKEFTIVDLNKERKAINYIVEQYGGYSGYFTDIPNEKFEIIGEITADEINFDVEPYVKSKYNLNSSSFQCTRYLNYVTNVFDEIFRTQSFYSLLQANGLLFSNPMGEDNFTDSDGYVLDDIAHKEWQEAESKVIKGKLVILKPI